MAVPRVLLFQYVRFFYVSTRFFLEFSFFGQFLDMIAMLLGKNRRWVSRRGVGRGWVAAGWVAAGGGDPPGRKRKRKRKRQRKQRKRKRTLSRQVRPKPTRPGITYAVRG